MDIKYRHGSQKNQFNIINEITFGSLHVNLKQQYFVWYTINRFNKTNV